MKINNRNIGLNAEEVAANYLIDKGYTILCRNFYCRTGEIDIIAKHRCDIIFIEVKFRKTNKFGYPSEAVTYNKQKVITKVAKYYILTHNLYNSNFRFDVIEILNNNINHIESAFNAVY